MKDYFKYKDKVCIVTGASSGMGEATTKILVDLGAKVYALDINECQVKGIEQFFKCNLSNKREIDTTFNKLPEHIDCFFGIAGLSGSKTNYRETFDCNYTSNMYITNKYLKARMSKGGAIVYCTSTAGLEWKKFRREQQRVVNCNTWNEVVSATTKLATKAPATFAYMYSKRCLAEFSCRKAVELAPLGIRVNNVLPAATNTGMKQEFQDMVGGEENLIKEAGLAGRLATSEEMANAMIFLNSDMASFISGIDMVVDYTDTCLKTLKLKKNLEAVSATNPIICAMAKKMLEKNKK